MNDKTNALDQMIKDAEQLQQDISKYAEGHSSHPWYAVRASLADFYETLPYVRSELAALRARIASLEAVADAAIELLRATEHFLPGDIQEFPKLRGQWATVHRDTIREYLAARAALDGG